MAIITSYFTSYTDVYATLILILATGACLGAPTQNLSSSQNRPWWVFPCPGQFPEDCVNGIVVPPRNPAVGRIQTQLLNAKTYFQYKRQYSFLEPLSIENNDFPELPKPLFQKFMNATKRRGKINIKDWLPKLQHDMQLFAATFDKLSSIKISSDVECNVRDKEREELLKTTKEMLRSLLCEVEKTMNESCLHPVKLKLHNDIFVQARDAEAIVKYVNGFILAENDCTHTLLQDFRVFYRYENALIQWCKILKNVRARIRHNTNFNKKNNRKHRKNKKRRNRQKLK